MTKLSTRQNKQFILSVCFLSIFSLIVVAQESKLSNVANEKPIVLTIEDAVDYANVNSRTLKSSKIDLEIKERASKYSWNTFVPTVSASATASRANEYVPSVMNALNPSLPAKYESEKERWTGIGSISVSLNLSLDLIQKIKTAHEEFESGKITWSQTVKENELNIRKLFYSLLLQQESLKVQETTLENARRRAIQAETNYRNGMIPELSMLRAQVSYENQRPDIEKQRQSLDQQLDTFAFMLGMPVGSKIELKGEINPQFVELNADELFKKYGTNNIKVQSIIKNINVLEAKLSALDLSAFTPSLNLSYGYKPSLISKGEWNSSENRYDTGSFSATLSWRISDILPFSANRQGAKDIKDNIRKLEVSLDTLMQNNELTVKKTVDSLEQAKKSIESNNRNIKLAQRSFDMTTIAYRNGTTELLDLRDAETQLNQAKLGMLKEQYNYLSYFLDLEYTLNTKLIGEQK